MSLSEPSPVVPRSGYGWGALIFAFLLGVGLMALLYGTGLLDQGRKAIATSIAGKGLVPIEALRFDERERLRAIAAKAAS